MSIYHEIFRGVGKRSGRVVRHPPQYRGGRLRDAEGLTRSEALHWLAHHPTGAALMQATDTPVSELADLLVEASYRNKHEASKMDSTTRIEKNLRAMGEHEYVRIVGDYAKRLYPDLSRERAFAKVFEAPDAEGAAIRKCWQLSKQGDSDEVAAAEDDESALDELNALAEQERRRSGTTKAVAFAKVYVANPELAARERRQNRPRA